jgi:hypothetical protein
MNQTRSKIGIYKVTAHRTGYCAQGKLKKSRSFFRGVFSGRSSRKNTTCGASHQLRVGIPVIFIRQSGDIVAGASLFGNTGEQLQSKFMLMPV